jgi:hypothetical protein
MQFLASMTSHRRLSRANFCAPFLLSFRVSFAQPHIPLNFSCSNHWCRPEVRCDDRKARVSRAETSKWCISGSATSRSSTSINMLESTSHWCRNTYSSHSTPMSPLDAFLCPWRKCCSCPSMSHTDIALTDLMLYAIHVPLPELN